jgi:uncharacterized protein (DUF2147 family)
MAVSAAMLPDSPFNLTWSTNMKKFFSRSLLLAALVLASPAFAFAAPGGAPESGRWITQSGNLEVEISPCGEALCGTVVKVIAGRSMSKPDALTAPADTRSPLGLKILTDFVAAPDGEWKGRIYNRENGETYDCLMSVTAKGQLKIHAYKGLPAFGRTQYWDRVSVGGTQ